MSDAKPYTMDDVQAWVEMRWVRERLDEKTMARIRATVEERDALKAQVEVARKALSQIANGYDDGVGASYYSGFEAAKIARDAMDEAAKGGK